MSKSNFEKFRSKDKKSPNYYDKPKRQPRRSEPLEIDYKKLLNQGYSLSEIEEDFIDRY